MFFFTTDPGIRKNTAFSYRAYISPRKPPLELCPNEPQPQVSAGDVIVRQICNPRYPGKILTLIQPVEYKKYQDMLGARQVELKNETIAAAVKTRPEVIIEKRIYHGSYNMPPPRRPYGRRSNPIMIQEPDYSPNLIPGPRYVSNAMPYNNF